MFWIDQDEREVMEAIGQGLPSLGEIEARAAMLRVTVAQAAAQRGVVLVYPRPAKPRIMYL
ncbi:MAG: hypothetical protein HRT64_12815 [Erythrobacter sp.]|nr:hypothetical protein [Erythrobacter sp.]